MDYRHISTRREWHCSCGNVQRLARGNVNEAAKLMDENQIRRLIVLNRAKQLVGIVSLGDLAAHSGDERLAGNTLKQVSEPAEPER